MAGFLVPRGSIGAEEKLIIDGVRVGVPPPEGYEVDFDNPARREDVTTYCVCAIGMPIAAAFLFQRLYVKSLVTRKLGWDDACIVLAWFGTVAIQAMIIHSFVHKYMGLHNFEMPFEKLKMAALLPGYVNSIVYQPPTLLAKMVILQFYRQINHVDKWFRWSVYFSEFVIVSTSVTLFILSAVPCIPIRASWDIEFEGESKCIDSTKLFESNAAIGVATDLLILMVPIPMVAGLQMSRIRKAGLMLMFAIGGLTTLTSMARLIVLMAAKGNPDRTWVSAPTVLWICVEANFFIICACLSTIRHFLHAISPGFLEKLDSMVRPSQPDSKPPSHELRTFGQSSRSRDRAYYNRFDDFGDTMVEVEGGPRNPDRTLIRSDNDSNEKLDYGDERSDKGIMKHSEVHVEINRSG